MSLRSRRITKLAALSSAFLLAGCSGMSVGNDLASIYEYAGGALHARSISLSEAAATPYASIGVRLGGSSEFMLVLATNDKSKQLWTSSARIAIVTRDGRVVRTAGLNNDLGDFQQYSRILQDSGHEDIRGTVDLPDLGIYGAAITCDRKSGSDEDIDILGKAIRTRRVEERCQVASGALDWRYKNTYWINPQSGFVWRSVQYVHPHLDALEIEVFRPPAQ